MQSNNEVNSGKEAVSKINGVKKDKNLTQVLPDPLRSFVLFLENCTPVVNSLNFGIANPLLFGPPTLQLAQIKSQLALQQQLSTTASTPALALLNQALLNISMSHPMYNARGPFPGQRLRGVNPHGPLMGTGRMGLRGMPPRMGPQEIPVRMAPQGMHPRFPPQETFQRIGPQGMRVGEHDILERLSVEVMQRRLDPRLMKDKMGSLEMPHRMGLTETPQRMLPQAEGNVGQWPSFQPPPSGEFSPAFGNMESNQMSAPPVEQSSTSQVRYTSESATSILASFGLSNEDLEELSRYPDDQLTPENMPFILRDIRLRKTSRQQSDLDTNRFPAAREGSFGEVPPTNVIDYGHASKYEYTEHPIELHMFNPERPGEETVKTGFTAQQNISVNSHTGQGRYSKKSTTQQSVQGESSSSQQKFAGEAGGNKLQAPTVKSENQKTSFSGLQSTHQPNFPDKKQSANKSSTSDIQESTSNQSDHSASAAGEKYYQGQTKDGVLIQSAYPTLKGTWVPAFPQADPKMMKRLPTPSMMSDYYAASPRIFPHLCSLCNVECRHLKDWIEHQNTTGHIESCRLLRQQYPDWNPEVLSTLRNEREKSDKSSPRRHSSPRRSRRSSSRHRSRHSRSRSPRRYRRSRSRSWSRSRSRSRSPRRLRRYSPRRFSPRRSRSPRWRSRSRSPRRIRSPRRPSPRRQRSSSDEGSLARRSAKSPEKQALQEVVKSLAPAIIAELKKQKSKTGEVFSSVKPQPFIGKIPTGSKMNLKIGSASKASKHDSESTEKPSVVNAKKTQSSGSTERQKSSLAKAAAKTASTSKSSTKTDTKSSADSGKKPTAAGHSRPKEGGTRTGKGVLFMKDKKKMSSGVIIHITELPNDGYTDQDILKVVQPFGKVSDILIVRSKNEAYLEMNFKEAASAVVNFSKTVPVLINGKRVKVAIAGQSKNLEKDKKDRKEQKVVKKKNGSSSKTMDPKKMGISGSSGKTKPNIKTTGKKSPQVAPDKKCIVIIGDLPSEGYSQEEVSQLAKKYGTLNNILILSSHKKAYLEMASLKNSMMMIKAYKSSPVTLQGNQLSFKILPEFIDIRDMDLVVQDIVGPSESEDGSSFHERAIHIDNLPNEGYTEAEVVCIGLRFGIVKNYVCIKSKNKAILQLDKAESAKSLCNFFEQFPPTLHGKVLAVSRSPKVTGAFVPHNDNEEKSDLKNEKEQEKSEEKSETKEEKSEVNDESKEKEISEVKDEKKEKSEVADEEKFEEKNENKENKQPEEMGTETDIKPSETAVEITTANSLSAESSSKLEGKEVHDSEIKVALPTAQDTATDLAMESSLEDPKTTPVTKVVPDSAKPMETEAAEEQRAKSKMEDAQAPGHKSPCSKAGIMEAEILGALDASVTQEPMAGSLPDQEDSTCDKNVDKLPEEPDAVEQVPAETISTESSSTADSTSEKENVPIEMADPQKKESSTGKSTEELKAEPQEVASVGKSLDEPVYEHQKNVGSPGKSVDEPKAESQKKEAFPGESTGEPKAETQKNVDSSGKSANEPKAETERKEDSPVKTAEEPKAELEKREASPCKSTEEPKAETQKKESSQGKSTEKPKTEPKNKEASPDKTEKSKTETQKKEASPGKSIEKAKTIPKSSGRKKPATNDTSGDSPSSSKSSSVGSGISNTSSKSREGAVSAAVKAGSSGKGTSSRQQDRGESRGTPKHSQERERRMASMKKDEDKNKAPSGRVTRSHKSIPKWQMVQQEEEEEEEMFPFNLEEFVTVDEIGEEIEAASEPKKETLRRGAKRKDPAKTTTAASSVDSKRRKGKVTTPRLSREELSFVTLDEIGEEEENTSQTEASTTLGPVNDPRALLTMDEVKTKEDLSQVVKDPKALLTVDEVEAEEDLLSQAVTDPQTLMTVDELETEEDLISQVVKDPQSLVTLDEIEDEEDMQVAKDTSMITTDEEQEGGGPALPSGVKGQALVTLDEIGEVEELTLNTELADKEGCGNDVPEKVIEDTTGKKEGVSSDDHKPGHLLLTGDNLTEDNEGQPLITLDELEEEEGDSQLLKDELNFVTVDEIGGEEEEEEKGDISMEAELKISEKPMPKKRGRKPKQATVKLQRRTTRGRPRGKAKATEAEPEEFEGSPHVEAIPETTVSQPPTAEKVASEAPETEHMEIKDEPVEAVEVATISKADVKREVGGNVEPVTVKVDAEVSLGLKSAAEKGNIVMEVGGDSKLEEKLQQVDVGMEQKAGEATTDIGKRKAAVLEVALVHKRAKQDSASAGGFRMPPFDPNVAIGVEFVVPKTGYFCRLCSLFYSNEDMAKVTHCKTQGHYQNMAKFMAKRVLERPVATDDQSKPMVKEENSN
ncbi:zinc finger protein 638 isoform X2 [Latimeria chalumnae]|uniref:zinc finger protein 638 isoform X2 n=1 Tax=Latimeria chalumnae TaxID=7897 RepID=UPI0006D925BC|nr:PREDICTED: zinc finger protein 638 isoform X2 [Latimeria chalumnae]|eukprot:XP_014342530.1 PREDICTED: zinc finger protein 638 isoform X2 [Latimeria chalumnae]